MCEVTMITVVKIIAPFDFGAVKDRRAFADSKDANEWANRRIKYFDDKEALNTGEEDWKHSATFDLIQYVEAGD